jgi:hypothetical protein
VVDLFSNSVETTEVIAKLVSSAYACLVTDLLL